jgi:hypothetical protein
LRPQHQSKIDIRDLGGGGVGGGGGSGGGSFSGSFGGAGGGGSDSGDGDGDGGDGDGDGSGGSIALPSVPLPNVPARPDGEQTLSKEDRLPACFGVLCDADELRLQQLHTLAVHKSRRHVTTALDFDIALGNVKVLVDADESCFGIAVQLFTSPACPMQAAWF